MKYERLSEDHQREMLEQRLRQYEGEHFNHSTNYDLLVEQGAENSAEAKQAQEAMKTLDKAHANTKKKAGKIPKKSAPTPDPNPNF